MSVSDRLWPVIAITGGSIAVGGCHDTYNGSSCGSYSSSCAAAQPGIDPSGIYEGTLTDAASRQSTPLIAILAENGDARMSAQNGTYYHLNVGTSGNALSGSYYGYSSTPNFPNGMSSTAGGVAATVTYQSSIKGTLTDSSGNEQTLSLTFDKVYKTPSSLATLAGNWSARVAGFTFSATIEANGTLTASDSNGCSYSGVFDLIDAASDAYAASFMRTCSGVDASFQGLASYFPASGAAPAQIELLSDDGNGDDLAVEMK